MSAASLLSALVLFCAQDSKHLTVDLLTAVENCDGSTAERVAGDLARANDAAAVKALMRAIETARVKEPMVEKECDTWLKKVEQLTPDPPSTPIPTDQYNALMDAREKYGLALGQRRGLAKVRPAVLEALRAFTSAGAGEELIRFLGSKDPEIREAALDGLRNVKGPEIDEEIEKTLVKKARSEKDPAVRAGMIDGIKARGIKTKDAIAAIRAGLLCSDWPVILSSALAVKEMDLRELAIDVIEAIKAKDGRLQFALNDVLRQMTGYNYDGDYEGWKAWHERFGEGFVAGDYQRPKASGQDAVASSTFYGVPIVSKALCFVLDRSGSMSEPAKWRRKGATGDTGAGDLGAPSGNRKIDIARFELKYALAKLPDGTIFNVIFYNQEFSVLFEKPQKLTAGSRRQAFDFIDALEPEGATNIYDSVEKGFTFGPASRAGARALGEIDTIMLLSDGMPNHGKYTTPNDILQGVEDINRNVKIQIDTVYVGSTGGRDPGAQLLEDLAMRNHGRFVSFD